MAGTYLGHVPWAVLLPKLYPEETVNLGYLLRDPYAPKVGARRTTVDKSSYAESTEEPYETSVAAALGGGFRASLTRLFGLSIGAKSSEVVQVHAQSMKYRTFIDADETLKNVCADEDVRKWINSMHLHRKKLYFVVGVQSLQNATIRREVVHSKEGKVSVDVPIQAVDVELGVGVLLDREGFGSANIARGVFGLELRKLICDVRESREVEELDERTTWAYSIGKVKAKGGKAAKQSIVVSLGDYVDDEL